MTDGPNRSRRAFLSLCGAAGLAGCLDADDGTTETSSPTATRSPRATETPTAEPASVDVAGARDWRTFGGDLGNTGHNHAAAPPRATPGAAWRFDVDGFRTMAAPAFVDGTVYVASGTTAYAMDAADGTLGWERPVAYQTHYFPPAVGAVGGDPVVFVGSRTPAGARRGGGDGRLYALDGASGDSRWTVDLPITGAPTVDDGRLYVPASSQSRGTVHALDPATGAVDWTHAVGGAERTAVHGAVAVDGDTVYVAASRYPGVDDDGATGRLLALDAADGTVARRVDLPDEVFAAPTVDAAGRVYVATTAGEVLAVADGDVRWRVATGAEIQATPVATGGAVFVLADSTVLRLDALSGTVRWQTSVAVPHGTELVTDGEVVYLGGNELAAIDAVDGEKHWVRDVPGGGRGAWGAPILAGNAILVGICVKTTDNGGLYDDAMRALVR